MKKKRFVKLLMAQGIQRNKATETARAVSDGGGTYKNAYISMLANPFSIIGRAHWNRAARRLHNGVKRAFRVDMIDALSYAIRAIGVAAPKPCEIYPPRSIAHAVWKRAIL